MNYDYYNNVPFQNDYPSDDQPQMQINCNSIAGIFQEDHVGFAISGGPSVTNCGYHRKITFNDVANPTRPTGTQSVDYTSNGVAKPVPQPRFQNAANTVNYALVKMFVAFTMPVLNSVSATIHNQYNLGTLNFLQVGNLFQVFVTPVSFLDNSPIVGVNPGVIITTSRPYQTQYNYIKNLNLIGVPPSVVGTPNIVTIILLQS